MIRDVLTAAVLCGAALGASAVAERGARAATPGGGAPPVVSEAPAIEPPRRPSAHPVDLSRGDPFRPFDVPAPAAGAPTGAGPSGRVALKFYGTVGTPTQRLASINDQLYKVGDKVDGATVKEIEAQRVILDRSGVLEVLTTDEEG